MNRWYRLGKEFSRKYSGETLDEYLKINNLYTTENANKDFKEKDYKKLCTLAGVTPEIEEKYYKQGERKYFFYWGFSKGEI